MTSHESRPRVLIFGAKLGYQTRAFDTAAQKLGIELAFVTDRCHRLDDPWRDGALPVHFEHPEEAAYVVMRGQSGKRRGMPQQVAHARSVPRRGVACALVSRGASASHPRTGAAGYPIPLRFETNFPFGQPGCGSREQSREVS